MLDPVDHIASEPGASPPSSPAVRKHGLRLPASRRSDQPEFV